MRKTLTHCLASLVLLSSMNIAPVFATCGGGGGGGDGGMGSNSRIYNVPWLRPIAGETPKEGVIIYWLPADLQESQTSPLRNSRMLALSASQCVSLLVEEPGSPDSAKIAALAKVSELPLVVMTTPDGTVIGKVEARFKAIDVASVEQMLAAELQKRGDELKAHIDAGKSKEDSGDKDGAITEFKAVYDQRCLFPKRAREAIRELKRLGVNDLAAVPDPPNFDPVFSAKIAKVMKDGLQAETNFKFDDAERLYLEAQKMDPADPAPRRYLGELYRHHIGDWVKARDEFNAILAMKSDPLSRAVALHGLGKMTIHDGEFKKGEALMERSVKTFPLALAYRNLAVYWNSEGDPVKADEYIKDALSIDPKDPYNLVFAAALEAKTGHSEDALKIATENEALLPASYNLAAIYAQKGEKEKALALLKRHFYLYERTANVRSKEMMEARVDAVFDSIVHDPAFLALTVHADGKLPMRDTMKQRQ